MTRIRTVFAAALASTLVLTAPAQADDDFAKQLAFGILATGLFAHAIDQSRNHVKEPEPQVIYRHVQQSPRTVYVQRGHRPVYGQHVHRPHRHPHGALCRKKVIRPGGAVVISRVPCR